MIMASPYRPSVPHSAPCRVLALTTADGAAAARLGPCPPREPAGGQSRKLHIRLRYLSDLRDVDLVYGHDPNICDEGTSEQYMAA